MTSTIELNYFTKEEALDRIGDLLQHGFKGRVQELHNEAFNSDYYIIGTNEAEKALEEYGVFNAIRKVREYEEFHESNTNVEDPEKLATRLFYIIGEEVFNEIVEKIQELIDNDYKIDDNTRRLLIDEINK